MDYEYSQIQELVDPKVFIKYDASLFRAFLKKEPCWFECPDGKCSGGNFKDPSTDRSECLVSLYYHALNAFPDLQSESLCQVRTLMGQTWTREILQ